MKTELIEITIFNMNMMYFTGLWVLMGCFKITEGVNENENT
jgi:hypothetical protein